MAPEQPSPTPALAPLAGDALDATPPVSPTRIFWRQLRRSPLAIAGGAVLLLFYALAAFAPFVAPYSQEEMDRARYFHPPHRLHWVDNEGRFHLIPTVRTTRLAIH